jgi:hypothetical protein
VHETGSEPSTTTLAVGAGQLSTAPPSVLAAPLMSDGVLLIVGGTSVIWTVKVTVPVLP